MDRGEERRRVDADAEHAILDLRERFAGRDQDVVGVAERRRPARRRPSRARARRSGRRSGCWRAAAAGAGAAIAEVERRQVRSAPSRTCSVRLDPPAAARAACSGPRARPSGAGVPPSMFGGRSVVGVLRAQIGERRARATASALKLASATCSMPQMRALSKLARTSTGTVVAGDEHGAVGVLRRDRLAAERRADGALRQDQRLLLDVVVDVVDEERQLGAPARRRYRTRALVLQAGLRPDLLDGVAGRDGARHRPSCRPCRSGPATSGAATSKPEPVSPSVPRSVMCGARKPRLIDTEHRPARDPA